VIDHDDDRDDDLTADLEKRMRELATKPHLWSRFGFWLCSRADSPTVYVGPSPADAYQAMRAGDGVPLSYFEPVRQSPLPEGSIVMYPADPPASLAPFLYQMRVYAEKVRIQARHFLDTGLW
jgi:hypothetical protein